MSVCVCRHPQAARAAGLGHLVKVVRADAASADVASADVIAL